MSAIESDELPCLLIPLDGAQLLLPNVVVAEVLRSQRLRSAAGLPACCVGHFLWRGAVLPLLSFEVANGGSAAPAAAPGDGVLVMNRTRDLAGIGFYGLITRGTPRLVRLAAEDLDEVVSTGQPLAELGRVSLGAEEAVIPDLARLENLILEYRLMAPSAGAAD